MANDPSPLQLAYERLSRLQAERIGIDSKITAVEVEITEMEKTTLARFVDDVDSLTPEERHERLEKIAGMDRRGRT